MIIVLIVVLKLGKHGLPCSTNTKRCINCKKSMVDKLIAVQNCCDVNVVYALKKFHFPGKFP